MQEEFNMRTALLGLGAAAVIGTSVAVISGQHAPAVHSAQQSSPPHAMVLHLCESAQGSSGETADRHTSMMAEKLGLTTEQRATVERVTTEACAAMAKYHEQILDVLTPEQREKLKKLHGHDDGGIHAILKKLHGGF
jgi:Spy/CpxP family protein refolding chaperone